MKQLAARALVLTRTDYGEADRILTVLTPESGKLRLMAKGVRRIRSKLAGGIELFSISHITFIKGRGDIDTLISTKLLRHYGHIVGDIQRVQLGYELIKLFHQHTEDHLESSYFELMLRTFEALDDLAIGEELIRMWFTAQLLFLGGHSPNLATDAAGEPLDERTEYAFDFTAMAFAPAGPQQGAVYDARHLKLMRLMFSGYTPRVLQQVRGVQELVRGCAPLIQTMRLDLLRI